MARGFGNELATSAQNQTPLKGSKSSVKRHPAGDSYPRGKFRPLKGHWSGSGDRRR